MAERRSQSDHDTLLSVLVEYLEKNGFTDIKADLPEFEQPRKVWWKGKEQEAHVPDATAIDASDVWHIFEIETEDTVSIEHSESQWKLFSAYANNNNGKFVVIVPTGSKVEAESQIERLRISAEVWT